MTGSDGVPRSIHELEERLSRPDDRVLAALETCSGDVMVLGAAGKMGPSLCRMLQRAVDEMKDRRRIIAVSRFGEIAHPTLAHPAVPGSEQIVCLRRDLTLAEEVATLPLVPNVIYMAGQKFGTSGDPSSTWAMNAAVPALVANRVRSSRMVVFSTGNVYPFTSRTSGGAREKDQTDPLGEYAWSCVARERIFEHYSAKFSYPLLLLRLNYAVDLRYGVIVDIASKVLNGELIDLAMGDVNFIWQGDANAIAIAALSHCAQPPAILNVTGVRTMSVRDIALMAGRLVGKDPIFSGVESDSALLSNSARMRELIGEPRVNEERLIAWVVEWLRNGGITLAKPTHFQERSGRF